MVAARDGPDAGRLKGMLVDDHEVVRKGLRSLIDSTDDSGIEAAREIRAHRPATRVLILTSYADELAVFSSIMAGAAGYLLKEVNSAELLSGIRSVGAGKSLLDQIGRASCRER